MSHKRNNHTLRVITTLLLAGILLLSSCGTAPVAPVSAAPSESAIAEPSPSESAEVIESEEPAVVEPVSTSEKHNDTMRLPVVTTFTATDPHYVAQNVDFSLAQILYEGFYDVDGQQNVTPRLATGYEVSEDGLVYTYHLKSGVKWQTGGEFKASDVVYSINRAKESPYMQSYVVVISDVQATDDLTVVITLANVSPTFYLTINHVYFVNEAATKDLEPGYANQIPGGTGPYTLAEWTPDQKVVVKRNETYHGNAASIGTIDFIVFGDTNAMLRAFESGEIDWNLVPAADWERIKSSDKYNTFTESLLSTFYFTMNCEKAPFDNVKVRQAFNYAVNKDDMMFASIEGNGSIANSIANPELVNLLPKSGEIFEYAYDPQKAKDLLAEAGYPDGLTLTEPILAMGSPEFTIPSQVFQEQLAAIGVKAEIQTVEQSAYISDVLAGNYSIGIMAIGLDMDASTLSAAYTTAAIGGLNLPRYSNARVDELFDLASKTLDQEARKKYFNEAFDIASKEAYCVPLYSMLALIATDMDLNSSTYKSYYDWSWK